MPTIPPRREVGNSEASPHLRGSSRVPTVPSRREVVNGEASPHLRGSSRVPTVPPRRVLVLGLGNPVRGDDGVGIHVLRHLQDLGRHVDLQEMGTAGLGLLEVLSGYRRVVVVDAIDMGAPPGTVVCLRGDDLVARPALHAASPHDADLLTTLELGAALGLPLPEELTVVAIQVEEIAVFSERCTPRVAEAIGEAARVVEELCGAEATVQ